MAPGDFVALSGDLGAGKTTLVRAMIAHLAGGAEIEVPSPTFTLVQTYDLPHFALVHADLYRLSGPDELAELGIDDLAGAVVVMEWPDRAGDTLPADRIEVALALGPEPELERRVAQIAGQGAAAARVAHLAALYRFLHDEGYEAAERKRIAGDASSRSYERLTADGRSFIVMNWPAKPDGPPVKRGLPYSAIAHLAEDVKPFVAMAQGLRERGFSAPKQHRVRARVGSVAVQGGLCRRKARHRGSHQGCGSGDRRRGHYLQLDLPLSIPRWLRHRSTARPRRTEFPANRSSMMCCWHNNQTSGLRRSRNWAHSRCFWPATRRRR